ncbi:MAG: NYN domain-containing protein [Calditrichaeota bacterium]|nr:NYN domain-containing protein [Calditrichota bacterium]HQU71224.1 NYN domain-containing protein [Calditrichia bacterium]
MLKAGIFLDVENLSRNGGWGIQYDVIKELARAQGATVLRANAYMAIDLERERSDPEYREKVEDYREAIRRNGFHLVLKEVRRFRGENGEVIIKANSDMDLAVDVLMQSENLDYILLGSGDGDFLRVVRALQNRGKRVDLLSFDNTNGQLRREVDYHFVGFLIPGLLRSDDREGRRRVRGVMHKVHKDEGYGFITLRTGLRDEELRYDIFCHIKDFSNDGSSVDNDYFANLKNRKAIIEFELKKSERGTQAINATEFSWRWTGGSNNHGPEDKELIEEKRVLAKLEASTINGPTAVEKVLGTVLPEEIRTGRGPGEESEGEEQ